MSREPDYAEAARQAAAISEHRASQVPWTDAKKIEIIGYLLDTHDANREDPEGDKYLSESALFVEAVEAVLNGNHDSSILRQFLASGEDVPSVPVRQDRW
jgi:hypothetical protein